jgi:hypothetical protein
LKRDRLISRRLERDAPRSSVPDQVRLLVTPVDSVREQGLIVLERLVAYRVNAHRIVDGPYCKTRLCTKRQRRCAKDEDKQLSMHVLLRLTRKYIMPIQR